MTTPTLLGIGVLVTRPESQASPLCRLLEASGATAVGFPAIDIRAAGDAVDVKMRCAAPNRFDLAVFTSVNAVRFGLPILGLSSATPLAAIGPATARALVGAGLHVAIAPHAGFDSERLLSHPGFGHLQGRRVLLVKGMHGRDLLREELVRRGAEVVIADVYARVRAEHTPAEMAALETRFASGCIQFITATSAEIAANLLETVTPGLRSQFDRVHWLVPGARVAGAIRRLGVTARLIEAASAEDHDLIAAIVRWRAIESEA